MGLFSIETYVSAFAEAFEVEDPEEEVESRKQEEPQQEVLQPGHVGRGQPTPRSSKKAMWFKTRRQLLRNLTLALMGHQRLVSDVSLQRFTLLQYKISLLKKRHFHVG